MLHGHRMHASLSRAHERSLAEAHLMRVISCVCVYMRVSFVSNHVALYFALERCVFSDSSRVLLAVANVTATDSKCHLQLATDSKCHLQLAITRFIVSYQVC